MKDLTMYCLFLCGGQAFRADTYSGAVRLAIAAGMPVEALKKGEFFGLAELGEDSIAVSLIEALV